MEISNDRNYSAKLLDACAIYGFCNIFVVLF